MTAPQRELIDDCVHCGFCLPHCPTYLNWGEEMDSPRGRIDLMRGLRTGEIAMTPTVAVHFDRCLGCMACVTACPSGVRYDVLIEETRAYVERKYRRGFWDRLHRWMIFQVFPYPRRLRAMAALLLVYVWTGMRWLVRHSGVLKLSPPRMRQLEELQPAVTLRSVFSRLPARVAAAGERRMGVALVAGCVQRVFNPGVNEATIRVLAAEGCEVVIPRGQGCCGALMMHAGLEEEGLDRARSLIDVFGREQVETIVTNAAGCGSNLKNYAYQLRDDPKYAEKAKSSSACCKDISEVLAEMEPRAARHSVALRAAYHDSCHLQHAQGVRSQPRQVLNSIPKLEVVEVPDAALCCGSAGIYNLIEHAPAQELRDRKALNCLYTGADVIVASNPGCLLQIAASPQRTVRCL